MIDGPAGAREKLKYLAGVHSPQASILSVTLSTSRLDDWRQSAPSFLNSELNRVSRERALSKDQKRSLQAELDQVLDLAKYEITPQTQGLAVFADAAVGLNERIELPLRLENRLTVEPSPHVRPVAHALSLLEPFLLAQVSRDDSSLYVVDEWGVSSEDDLTGPWLRSSDRETGEVSIKKYYAASRLDTLVEQHFKEVGSSLAKLLEVSGARRVVLCAQHEIAAAFRRTLPPVLVASIVAEIPLDTVASTGQLVAGARKAMEGARQREMGVLAERIKEGLGPGGHGISGFDDVLGALERSQVQTLLVARGHRPPGWRCLECTWVGLAELVKCPRCGGETVPVMDAVGELVRLAILQSGDVEVAEDLPLLDELGGVAGILRYA